MASIPTFDEIKYLLEIHEAKEKNILLRKLSIFSCEEAIKELPDTPTKDRDTQELHAQIGRFKDEIDGYEKDKKNIKKFIAILEKDLPHES